MRIGVFVTFFVICNKSATAFVYIKAEEFMEIITHLTTPFYMNAVDCDVLGFSVDRQARYKVDGVHVCGWWGEKSTLKEDEHLLVARRAVESSEGRIKVYASAGSNDTAKSESMAKELLSLGVDGISLTMPYYNKGSEKEIVKSAQKIKALCKNKTVFFFYEKDKTLSKDGETALEKEGVKIVRADGKWSKSAYDGDEYILSALCVNSTLFSVLSNVFPSAITHIREEWNNGKPEKARDMYFELEDKIRILQSGGVPYLKYALSLWGLSYPAVRSPYIECDDDEKALLRCFFD